jgi:hypothetical protein
MLDAVGEYMAIKREREKERNGKLVIQSSSLLHPNLFVAHCGQEFEFPVLCSMFNTVS